MVQYDFNKVYVGEIKQDVFVITNAPIMANSKDGQDHKDKYFDSSRKILSQGLTTRKMEALIFNCD